MGVRKGGVNLRVIHVSVGKGGVILSVIYLGDPSSTIVFWALREVRRGHQYGIDSFNEMVKKTKIR